MFVLVVSSLRVILPLPKVDYSRQCAKADFPMNLCSETLTYVTARRSVSHRTKLTSRKRGSCKRATRKGSAVYKSSRNHSRAADHASLNLFIFLLSQNKEPPQHLTNTRDVLNRILELNGQNPIPHIELPHQFRLDSLCEFCTKMSVYMLKCKGKCKRAKLKKFALNTVGI